MLFFFPNSESSIRSRRPSHETRTAAKCTQKDGSSEIWRHSPFIGEGGEAQGGNAALLAESDRDPGGDELIWIGATVPSTTRAKDAMIGSMNLPAQQPRSSCSDYWIDSVGNTASLRAFNFNARVRSLQSMAPTYADGDVGV